MKMERKQFAAASAFVIALASAGIYFDHRHRGEALRRPEDCPQVIAPDAVYHNYVEVTDALKTIDDLEQLPRALCFVSDPAKVGRSPDLAYREIVAGFHSPDVLYQSLLKGFGDVLESDLKQGLRRRAGLAWQGVWLGEAALVAYQKTGQARFLDLFVGYYDDVLDRRDDKLARVDAWHGRVMKAWGSVNLAMNKKNKKALNASLPWIAHITHNARIVFPGTEFALIVRKDPDLARYRAKAAHYVNVAEEVLGEFDADRVALPGREELVWYNRPLVDRPEPTNHLHMVARAWANLYELTGKKRYSDDVNSVLSIFESGLKKEPHGLLSWGYAPALLDVSQREAYTNDSGYSEPIWKATHTTQFLLQAQRQGYASADGLAPKVARMLKELTFQGDRVWSSVALRGGRYFDPEKDGVNLNVVALITYRAHEPELVDKIPFLVSSRPDIFPKGWLWPSGLFSYANLLGGSGH